VYMPFGDPPRITGGGDARRESLRPSLLRPDALTGKLKWYFRFHHDTWDYEFRVPAGVGLTYRNGRKIPAIAQLSKMGLLFISTRYGSNLRCGRRPGAGGRRLPGDYRMADAAVPAQPPPLARIVQA